MKIAFAATEVVPFAKTGGLADVAGALPKALAKKGMEVKVFMPKYFSIDETKFELSYCWSIGEIPIRVAGHVWPTHVFSGKLPHSNVEIYFVECSHYFHREYLYTNDRDEDERFILFSKAIIEICQRLNWAPDVFHCNDWQTGLLPLYLKDNYSWDRMFNGSASLFTIHNIGYQGRFPLQNSWKGEIRGEFVQQGGAVEFHNSISFLKAGILFSETITTVSHTYAHEILTPAYGAGMEEVLKIRANDLHGILNGIDYDVWNPETDKLIPYNYSSEDLSGKEKNKEYLIKQFRMPYDKNVPLIGIVSRLVTQKGFDLIADVVQYLINLDAQWIILGSGEDRFEDLFRSMSYAYPHKAASYIGYNNELSHLIEAGADIFLMPSHYEPCGLNQIYSLKYGTVPVVRKTGGLADTVFDWHELQSFGSDKGTGFSFNDATGYALYTTLNRAIETYHNKAVWRKIQLNGMNQNYSWEKSAERYIQLYEQAVHRRKRL